MSTSTPEGFQDFTFDEGDGNVRRRARRFKAKEDTHYRASVVWYFKKKDEAGNDTDEYDFKRKPRFTGCKRHYTQGVGFYLHQGPEYTKIAGEPPKQCVASIFVFWPVDSKGRLRKEEFARGEGFQVLPWVMSAERYNEVKLDEEDFPLATTDRKMFCKDAQYQKMDIKVSKECFFRTLLESDKPKANAVTEAIIAEVRELEKTIFNEMARPLTIAQIREKKGGGGGGSGSVVSGAADEEVDSLVGNLLDDDDE
jgi:hypothetical protein